MKRVIWKFLITVNDSVEVPMPQGADVLHVGHQRGDPDDLICLWALVDPDAVEVIRTFEVRGTGHLLGPVGFHLGTVQAGPFVWHVFEGGDRA